MKSWMLILALVLLVPCQSCGWDDGGDVEPCAVYECGTYRMNGEWKADLHQETWNVADDGSRENYQSRDRAAILQVASTGCGASISGKIPALYTDDELIINSDFVESFDDAGNYRYEWSWRGKCTLELCELDVEVTVFNGNLLQIQRGLFTFTNLVPRGE